jgi:alpha-glucosidase (family GH31 glycosyl hydrolase)
MADFGEYLPFDAEVFQGNAAVEHNKYPEQWANVNRMATDNRTAADAVFFMRASATRSPKYSTLFWLGDQLTSFDEYDGLRTTINGHLSSGLSGMSLQHSDVGGYTMVGVSRFASYCCACLPRMQADGIFHDGYSRSEVSMRAV